MTDSIFDGGDGGIRTHGPLMATKRFRVVLVMTTSIHLRVSIIASFKEEDSPA